MHSITFDRLVEAADQAFQQFKDFFETVEFNKTRAELTDEGADALPDISVVREKYAATSKYFQELDRVANWLLGQTDLIVAEVPPLGALEVLDRLRDVLAKAMSPGPSIRLIEADLDASAQYLGESYSEALVAHERLYQAAFPHVQIALHDHVRTAGEEPPGSLAVFPIRAAAQLLGLKIVPAGLLLRQLEHSLNVLSSPNRIEVVAGQNRRQDIPGDLATLPTPSEYEFKQVGQIWHLRFRAESGDFKDCKALRHLAKLLASPNKPIPSLDLQGAMPEMKAISQSSQPTIERGDFARIKDQIESLNAEIIEAKKNNDGLKSEKLQIERENLLTELTKASGIRSKSRELGPTTPARRATDTVRKAFSSFIKKIKRKMPAFAGHLDSIYLDGTSYTYRPDNPPPSWQF